MCTYNDSWVFRRLVRAAAPRSFGGVGRVAHGGLLAVPIAVAVEHELVGGGLQSVDRRLGEEGIGHEAEPLDGLPVRRGDGGRPAVAFDDQLVDVGGVEGVERLEAEVSQFPRCSGNWTTSQSGSSP